MLEGYAGRGEHRNQRRGPWVRQRVVPIGTRHRSIEAHGWLTQVLNGVQRSPRDGHRAKRRCFEGEVVGASRAGHGGSGNSIDQKVSRADPTDRCAEGNHDRAERLDSASRRIHRNNLQCSTQPGDSDGQQDQQPDNVLGRSKHSGHGVWMRGSETARE